MLEPREGYALITAQWEIALDDLDGREIADDNWEEVVDEYEPVFAEMVTPQVVRHLNLLTGERVGEVAAPQNDARDPRFDRLAPIN